MKRPHVDVDLRPYFKGEERGRSEKTLIVLHETVSHNRPGTGDILGVALYLDQAGLEMHGIIDKEGLVAWCYDPTAVYDHAASGKGKVNTRSIGFELVSEIPMLATNAERRAAWLHDSRKLQLDTIARWCAWLSTQHAIPLVFSAADRPGITTHYNVSRTYLGGEGHWDCKPIHSPYNGHFPALYVIRRARELVAQEGNP